MTQLFLKSFAYLAAIVLMFATTSCDTVLQYPEGEGIDPTLVKTTIELRTDFTPIQDPIYASYSYAEARDGFFDVRYIIEIYSSTGRRIARSVETSDILSSGNDSYTKEFDLHPGDYDIYAWIDFVPHNSTDDFHYTTDDLHCVEVNHLDNGDDQTEDAFAGKKSVSIPNENEFFTSKHFIVDMERPFGRFRIVTTDVKKFLDTYKPTHSSYADAVPTQTILKYTCYMPTAYRLDTRFGEVGGMVQGIKFTMPTVKESEEEMTLSSDFVIVTNDNTTVSVDIEVRNSLGERLNGVGGIRIPIQRNKLTIVKGEFLTLDIPGNGSGIDDSFDDEFIIWINN